MKLRTKKHVVSLCLALMACSVVSGAVALGNSTANAVAESTPAVQMLTGARARKHEGTPGLKFEAIVNGYDAEDTTTSYGMLILPEKAFTLEGLEDNYHAYLTGKGLVANEDFVDLACTPYTVDGDTNTYIAGSISPILEENYTTNFVGIAYELSGETYEYASVNMLDNSRSVAYVAQMALKYEAEKLTDTQKSNLQKFITSGDEIVTGSEFAGFDKLNDLVISENFMAVGNATATNAEGYVKIDLTAYSGFAAATPVVPFETKDYYTGITEITFDAMASDVVGRIGLTFRENEGTYNYYTSALDGGTCAVRLKKDGVWYNYKMTVAEDGTTTFAYKATSATEYTSLWSGTPVSCNFTSETAYSVYFYIEPKQDNTGAICIDNFSITHAGGTVTEKFNGSNYADNATVKDTHSTGAASIVMESVKELSIGATANSYVNFDFSKFNQSGAATVVSKNTFTNLSEMSFDAYIVSKVDNAWWGMSPIASVTGSKYTGSNLGAGSVANISVTGEWIRIKYESKDNGANWKITYTTANGAETTVKESVSTNSTWQDSNGASYVYFITGFQACNVKIDNVKIVADGTTYTDGFDGGKSSLFDINSTTAVTFETVEFVPELSETVYTDKCVEADFTLWQTNSGSSLTMVSKTAYTNLKEVTFDAYIPTGKINWWGAAPVAKTIGQSCYTGGGESTWGNSGSIAKDTWVTIKYQIDGLTWTGYWALQGSTDFTKLGEKTFDNSANKYQAADGSSYIYVLGAMGAGNFDVKIKLDNFKIVANDVTYTDDFNSGVSALFDFNAGTSGTPITVVANGEGETVNKIHEYVLNQVMNQKGAIMIGMNGQLSSTLNNVAVLEGVLSYSITGEKTFAILLGFDDVAMTYGYLVVDNDSIAFYFGNTLVKEVALTATENDLYISMLANGNVLVKIGANGDYVGMGNVCEPGGFVLVDVAGMGSVEFTKIALDTFELAAAEEETPANP